MIKWLGCALIIIGTTIGGGMLALPLISGLASFPMTCLYLASIWLIMTATGLLTLEVCLHLPTQRNNFASMARATLGPAGQWLTAIALPLLLYTLSWAYISASSNLLSQLPWHLPSRIEAPVAAILFTACLGGIVWWSTRCVDIINRLMMLIKFSSLFVLLYLLFQHTHWQKALDTHTLEANTLLGMAPVFLTAFGYHHVIPSLRNYLGDQALSLRYAIIAGTSIPFLIYFLWLLCTHALIPQHGAYSYATFNRTGVAGLIAALIHFSQEKQLPFIIHVFSNIAVTTSFLGVTLGLFDFMADTLKRLNTRRGRMQTALITFLPPLLATLFLPNSFTRALVYAGIFVAVLEVLLPAAMAWRQRQKGKINVPHLLPGGDVVLWLIMGIAVLLMLMEVSY